MFSRKNTVGCVSYYETQNKTTIFEKEPKLLEKRLGRFDMHTYTFIISPNNRPGTSDRKEVTVTASDVGWAKKKVQEMYPNAFFYGGVVIDKHF